MDKDVEGFLKFIRDLLTSYSNLVETVLRSNKEYGYDHTTNQIDLSDPATLQDIFDNLTPSKIGLLVSTMFELSANQDKLKDVMTLNKKDLNLLHKSLESSISNLNKIVGEKP